MKKFLEKVISLVLVLLVVFGSMSFAMQNKAFSATTLDCPDFTVNGKVINEDSVEPQGKDGCVKYAKKMYEIIWGVEYNNKITGDSATGYNMLSELSGEERKIDPGTAWKYISQAAVGAVIRTDDTATSADGDGGNGHSLIIVEITQDGFTALEHWSSKGGVTQEYTWEEFAHSETNESFHPYFKYIKWPGAHTYTEPKSGTGKCGDNAIYAFDESTGTLTISGTGEMWGFADEGMIWDIQPWRNYKENIKKVVVSEGITKIGLQSFMWCRNINEVMLPNSLLHIGRLAFALYTPYGSNSIDVYYSGSEEQWKKITIDERNDDLYSATIHYNYTEKEPTFFEKVASFFEKIFDFFASLFSFLTY